MFFPKPFNQTITISQSVVSMKCAGFLVCASSTTISKLYASLLVFGVLVNSGPPKLGDCRHAELIDFAAPQLPAFAQNRAAQRALDTVHPSTKKSIKDVRCKLPILPYVLRTCKLLLLPAVYYVFICCNFAFTNLKN